MTSYLGPDNPPPLSLVSENNQRFLQVSKVSDDTNALFSYGDEYYIKIAKLLRLQAGINIDDSICVVASRKSKLPQELENRLCLLNPVLHLTAGTVLYENSPSSERDFNVATVPVNAEIYLSKQNNHKKFDKIIIADGLEMVEDHLKFLKCARSVLKSGSDSSLIIFHKTKEFNTLPVFMEVLKSFGEHQIEVEELMEHLIKLNFLVGWNIVTLPIQVPKTKWFNQLYNFHPPIMEVATPTNIYAGLRELIDTSFKYADFLVTVNDRFLLIVASVNDLVAGHTPYKMLLFDEDFSVCNQEAPKPNKNNLLRLNITPDIRHMVPKNTETYIKSEDLENRLPEEWWGTMPSMTIGQLDKNRINHFIN